MGTALSPLQLSAALRQPPPAPVYLVVGEEDLLRDEAIERMKRALNELIIEGIPYFGFPNKVKEWALAIQEVPDRSLRLLGLIIMAAGLIILYFVSIF